MKIGGLEVEFPDHRPRGMPSGQVVLQVPRPFQSFAPDIFPSETEGGTPCLEIPGAGDDSAALRPINHPFFYLRLSGDFIKTERLVLSRPFQISDDVEKIRGVGKRLRWSVRGTRKSQGMERLVH